MSWLAVACILASNQGLKPMEWHSLLAKEQFRFGDNVLPYRFMAPAKIEEGKKYPLVIFLHGATTTPSS
jgi:predicted peptidase